MYFEITTTLKSSYAVDPEQQRIVNFLIDFTNEINHESSRESIEHLFFGAISVS